MRTYLLIAGFFLAALSPLMAQPRGQQMEERVRAMRVAFITERMKLSPEEAEKFWPLQNEFEAEQRKIREKYRPDRDLATMTDAEVERQIANMLDMEEDLVKLKRDYVSRFKRVVPLRKIAVYMRAETEFNRSLLQAIQQNRRN